MKRTIVAMLVLVACGKSSQQSSTGSGSAVAADPQAIDAMVADMMAYADQMIPMMLAWDGDCAAQAKRMLPLEPLAQRIRAGEAKLTGDPARRDAYKAAMASKKAGVMADLDKKLAAAGKTTADVDRIESELKTKCASDPAFTEAMNRVGLRKKN